MWASLKTQFGNSAELAWSTHLFHSIYNVNLSKITANIDKANTVVHHQFYLCKHCQHSRDLCMLGCFYLTLQSSMLFYHHLGFFLDVHAFLLAELLSGISMPHSLSPQLFFSGFTSAFLRLQFLDYLVEKADCWWCEAMTGVNDDVVGAGSNDGLGWDDVGIGYLMNCYWQFRKTW